MNTKQFSEAVEKEITRANGRRRTRLIDEYDVAQALREAMAGWNDYGFRCGGRVAKAYDYQAWMSAVYSIQIAPKVLAVSFGEIDAKIFSETTWATGAARNQIAEQRLSFGPRVTDYYQYPHLIVSRRIAGLYIKNIDHHTQIDAVARMTVGDQIRKLAGVVLTQDLSLRSGNCQSQTARVAALVGKPQATVAEIIETLEANNLGYLESFVLRAARFTARYAAGGAR